MQFSVRDAHRNSCVPAKGKYADLDIHRRAGICAVDIRGPNREAGGDSTLSAMPRQFDTSTGNRDSRSSDRQRDYQAQNPWRRRSAPSGGETRRDSHVGASLSLKIAGRAVLERGKRHFTGVWEWGQPLETETGVLELTCGVCLAEKIPAPPVATPKTNFICRGCSAAIARRRNIVENLIFAARRRREAERLAAYRAKEETLPAIRRTP